MFHNIMDFNTYQNNSELSLTRLSSSICYLTIYFLKQITYYNLLYQIKFEKLRNKSRINHFFYLVANFSTIFDTFIYRRESNL